MVCLYYRLLTFREVEEMQFVAPNTSQIASVGNELVLCALVAGTEETPTSKNAEKIGVFLGERDHPALPFLHRCIAGIDSHYFPPLQCSHVQLMDRIVIAIAVTAVPAKSVEMLICVCVGIPIDSKWWTSTRHSILPEQCLRIKDLDL